MDKTRGFLKQVDRTQITDFLKSMLKASSINPPGQELECAEVVAHKLEEIGMEVELSEAESKRPNVVGWLNGAKGSPTLLYNGHMDVVPVGHGWTRDPFGGEVEGNKIFGRGAADMKSGLASMIMGVEALTKAHVKLQGNLVITAVVDEETGSTKGTRYLIEKGLKADMAIVSEPTDMRVEIANKGILWAEIVIHGRGSHASRPHIGVNAIDKMNLVINALHEMKFDVRDDMFDVPIPTLTVTIISGGTKINVVPDYCRIEIDRRILPGETTAKAFREIQNLVNNLKTKDPELNAELRMLNEWPPMEISPEEPIVKSLIKTVKTLTHREPKVIGKAGATDASFLVNDARIPTVLFGPGDPRHSHTPDEYVDIENLYQASKIFAVVAYDVLR